MVENYTADRVGGSSSVARWLLRRTATAPDWYFAYTEGSAARLAPLGYPSSRVTVLQNALDTTELREELKPARNTARPSATCIFLGSLHADKRIQFVIDAADRLAGSVSDFRLIIAGDGVLRAQVEAAASSRPWLQYVGRVEGARKAEALGSAALALAPGQVGLGLLDLFAARVPPVLCAVPFRGPETEYAIDGFNCVELPAHTTPADYAAVVARTLCDPEQLGRLRRGCHETSDRITLSEMVANYAEGILAALEAGARPGHVTRRRTRIA